MVAVIGVDPGDTCGVARYVDGEFAAVQCIYQDALGRFVLPWLDEFSQVVVSVERYTIGAQTVKMSRQPTALHVIGIIKLECERRPGARFVQHQPGDAKRLGSVALLRRLGLYLPGLDHANDALSHTLIALATYERASFKNVVRSGTVRLTRADR